MFRDIKRTAREGEVEDVATAVAVATEALETGDLERALELLEWAGSRATRSVAIREGLGVALYLDGQFEQAQRELQAYRRMSGRADQNHLLADCARALGRTDKVDELIEQMQEEGAAKTVPMERLVEGLIVQAAMHADDEDFEGALMILDQAPLVEETGVSHVRLWYAAGDIAERMGDLGRARDYFEAVLAVEDDFGDTEDRLAALQE